MNWIFWSELMNWILKIFVGCSLFFTRTWTAKLLLLLLLNNLLLIFPILILLKAFLLILLGSEFGCWLSITIIWFMKTHHILWWSLCWIKHIALLTVCALKCYLFRSNFSKSACSKSIGWNRLIYTFIIILLWMKS